MYHKVCKFIKKMFSAIKESYRVLNVLIKLTVIKNIKPGSDVRLK